LHPEPQFISAILEAVPSLLCLLDNEGRIHYCNRAFETLTGWDANDLLNTDFATGFLLPAEHPAFARILDRLQNGESPLELDATWLSRSGETHTIHQRFSILGNPASRQTTIILTGLDITANRRQQFQLEQQAALLEIAHEIIIVRDLDDTITFWNPAAEKIYGYSAREAIGKRLEDLLYQGHDPEPTKRAKAAVKHHGHWSGDLYPVSREGKRLIIQSNWTLVHDHAGIPRSILSISTDVTHTRDLETQFFRAQRMESIGVLAGGIAHDLNNILAPIVLATDTLREELSTTPLASTVELLASSAKRGADLVRQVLLFARGSETPRSPVDLLQPFQEVRSIIEQTFPKSIRFISHLEPGLPCVIADPTLLQQVLLNLCINARDAMPNGGTIELHAFRSLLPPALQPIARSQLPGPAVTITLSDTGSGMPPEVLARIFEPFYTTKLVGEGTGLGLSTALSIIRSHGGDLSAQSAPGKGTTFTLILPALQQTPLPPAQPLPAPIRPSTQTILIVDDEAAIRHVARLILTRFGFQCIEAANGLEALTTLRTCSQAVSIVLLDMAMPQMDGPTALPKIKSIAPHAKVIAVSGISPNQQAAEIAPCPAIDFFLQKPFSAADLQNAIATLQANR